MLSSRRLTGKFCAPDTPSPLVGEGWGQRMTTSTASDIALDSPNLSVITIAKL